MTYSENRPLRERLWKAYNSRAYADENDNRENIKKLVALRNERAQLLGYKTHAHFVLDGSGPAHLEAPSLSDWPKVTWTASAASTRVNLDTLTPADYGNLRIGLNALVKVLGIRRRTTEDRRPDDG